MLVYLLCCTLITNLRLTGACQLITLTHPVRDVVFLGTMTHTLPRYPSAPKPYYETSNVLLHVVSLTFLLLQHQLKLASAAVRIGFARLMSD